MAASLWRRLRFFAATPFLPNSDSITMLPRIFLAVVGVLYAGLAIYCAVAPNKAADTVGLDMKGGSGRSEFLTVYGGLEMGMAAFFLFAAWKPEHARSAVLACLAIHGCLVLFRSASFMMFDGIGGSTYKLAVGEWVIFLASIAVWWKGRV